MKTTKKGKDSFVRPDTGGLLMEAVGGSGAGVSVRDWFAAAQNLTGDFHPPSTATANALAGWERPLDGCSCERMRWEADLRAAVQYLRGDAMMRAREREVKVGAKREVKVKGVERWMKPFKNLPETANWIAVDSDGMCYWYEVRPRCMVWVWSFGSEGVANWMKRLKRPSDWKNAIREVHPSERCSPNPQEALPQAAGEAMSTPPRPIERWQEPFKDLPMKANWICADSAGDCRWHETKPHCMVDVWLSLFTACGWIDCFKRPSDWENALRQVQPEERIGYKPEASR